MKSKPHLTKHLARDFALKLKHKSYLSEKTAKILKDEKSRTVLQENVHLLSRHNDALGLGTFMTLKWTLLLCQIYSGWWQVTRFEFHPLPNWALLCTTMKYCTTSTPLSPTAKIREWFISEQKVTSSESPHQLLRHTEPPRLSLTDHIPIQLKSVNAAPQHQSAAAPHQSSTSGTFSNPHCAQQL